MDELVDGMVPHGIQSAVVEPVPAFPRIEAEFGPDRRVPDLRGDAVGNLRESDTKPLGEADLVEPPTDLLIEADPFAKGVVLVLRVALGEPLTRVGDRPGDQFVAKKHGHGIAVVERVRLDVAESDEATSPRVDFAEQRVEVAER